MCRILEEIIRNHVLTSWLVYGDENTVVTLRFGSHAGCVQSGTIQDTEYGNVNRYVSGRYYMYRSKPPSNIKRDQERQHIWLNKGSGNNDTAVIYHTHEQCNTAFTKPNVQDSGTGIDLSQNHKVLLSSTMLLYESVCSS